MPHRHSARAPFFVTGVLVIALAIYFVAIAPDVSTRASTVQTLPRSAAPVAPLLPSDTAETSRTSSLESGPPSSVNEQANIELWREQSGMNLLEEAAYIYTRSAGMSDSIRSEYASYSVEQLMRMADNGDGKAAFLVGLNDTLNAEQQQQYLERSLLTGNYTLAAFQIAMVHENAQLQTHAPLMLRLEQNSSEQKESGQIRPVQNMPAQNNSALTDSDMNYLVWLTTAAALNDVFSQNLLTQRLLPHLGETDIAAIHARADDNLQRLNAQRNAAGQTGLRPAPVTPAVREYVTGLYREEP